MNSYDYHRQAKIDKAIDKTAGIYPGGNGEDYLHSGLPGVGYVATRWARQVSTVFVCTRAEFEARKAERQNKPSWDDAPDWARWLAQDDQGLWIFSQGKLLCDFIQWTGQWRAFATGRVGEVIGDWRNTLDQRSNAVGRPPLQVNLIPAVDGESPIDTANRMIHALLQRPNHIGESGEKVCFDFEALANQFDDVDDINAVWALRDKLHHKNKPEPSPELSFHLSNAFNELQASARLLSEDDPRRASIVSLASGIGAVREVV